MDSVTEFEATDLVGPEQGAEADAAARKRDRERLRLRRKLSAVKKRARAQGFLDGAIAQLKPGDIVVECGANVGAITRRLAETGATVYAFEPDPLAYAELERRCGTFPNLCLVNAAVGTSQGHATLYRSSLFGADPLKATLSSTVIPDAQSAEGEADIEVPVFDLPSLLTDVLAGRDPAGLPERLGVFRRPDALALLLLDVEGAELEILDAMQKGDLLGQIRTTMTRVSDRKVPHLRRGMRRLRAELAEQHTPAQVFLDWA